MLLQIPNLENHLRDDYQTLIVKGQRYTTNCTCLEKHTKQILIYPTCEASTTPLFAGSVHSHVFLHTLVVDMVYSEMKKDKNMKGQSGSLDEEIN
jgi:hypothetical protein